MLFRELRKHQWKAFSRHPQFEQNMAMKIFLYIVFGLLGLELLVLGFFLVEFLSKHGAYDSVIDSFNYFLLYVFLVDFVIKYMIKQNQSMLIAPYLTIPIKRTTLYNYLLTKEFASVWNIYFLFVLFPFAFRAIPPHYGYLSAFLYVLFIYLLCVCNSLLVAIANNLLKRSELFLFLPIIIVAAIVGVTFIPVVNIEDSIVKAFGFVLENNIIAWLILLLAFVALWSINLSMMNAFVYRFLQGKKVSDAGSFDIPFIDRLGKKGAFVGLEIKMLLRSKRFKMLRFFIVIIPFYSLQMYLPFIRDNYFNQLFFTMLVTGSIGMQMAQYIFTTESSFFDGLMTRNLSLLDMLKGKYIFYIFCSTLMLFLVSIFVIIGKLDFLFLISVFFYTIGFVFFLLFQNAVKNKSFIDHSESGANNQQGGISGNMTFVAMFGLFIPVGMVVIIKVVFNDAVANYFMLVTGFAFTITAKYWLTWVHNRFLKRKYKNMEGFRVEN
jgi:hypothetical protein